MVTCRLTRLQCQLLATLIVAAMQLSISQIRSRHESCHTACSSRTSLSRSCTRIASLQSKRNNEQTADSVTSAGRPLNAEKDVVEKGIREADSSSQPQQVGHRSPMMIDKLTGEVISPQSTVLIQFDPQDTSGKDIGEQLASLRSESDSGGLLQVGPPFQASSTKARQAHCEAGPQHKYMLCLYHEVH